ncbi:MAG: pyruvate formate lyase family protein [Flexilinea sp.]
MLTKSLQNRIAKWFERDYRLTFFERITCLIESEKIFADLPYAERYGKTLEYILSRISQPMDPQEKVVGSFLEIIPTDQQKEYVDGIYRKWWAEKPVEEIQKDILFFYSYGWLKCRPPWFYSFGHLALDWEGIITTGLQSFADRAEQSLVINKAEDKQSFLNGAIICINAISAYIARYAQTVKEAGNAELAESLLHISTKPARTFGEALQLIWFVAMISQKVCGCGVLNFSRMDKYLYKYYLCDIQNGILTKETALELIQEFYFKNNQIMIPTDHMSQEIETTKYTLEVTYDDPNYLILGGLNSDGSSGVNELSFLMIQATHEMKLKNPFIVVRYHHGIDGKFWLKVCSAMRDNATIVIYNDEKMIPALKRYGAEAPEVYDYGFFGCNDPVLSAHEGSLRQLWLNLAKPLELAMNRGDYPMEPRAGKALKDCQFSLEDRMIGLMTGPYYGVDTPALSEMTSMEDVISAYKQQVYFLMEDYRRGFESDIELEKIINKGRLRIEDCFLKGTLEEGVTWVNGGTKYHKVIVQGTGMATVADSLYAIDKLVFQDKSLTLEQFNDILKQNWQGNEMLQMKIRRMKKFGNDEDEADQYARLVVDIFAEATGSVNSKDYLYSFYPTLSSDRDFTTMGYYVGATADGRNQKEKLSENQSPTEGSDVSGITALLNSVSKVPFEKITGGPLNLRLHPSSISGEQGANVLAALLKTYLEKGGLQIQINVVDKETLIEAKKNPNKYRNLCVRVTGYSAFFTQMGEKAQDELIHRTEQIVCF